MKRKVILSVTLIFVLGMGVWTGGCAKKAVPQPAAKAVEPEPAKPTTPAPAPTISLSAQPSAITKGQSTVLSWKSSNATAVELDGGIGTVANSGRVTLEPSSSVTYTAKATGLGGSAVASTRITVNMPVVLSKPQLSDRQFFEKRIGDVFFDYDQYDMRTDQQGTAEDNARALKERPNLRFTIEGHCDERGSEKYNLALGDKRANVVKAYLVDKGIPADQIDTTSYGKERPFDPGHNEQAWAVNRRGHFVLK
jgi:peptidoglycan-associated lipoprotein